MDSGWILNCFAEATDFRNIYPCSDKSLITGFNKKRVSETETLQEWEHTGSNRGPSACKADALNQLSYAPKFFVRTSNFERLRFRWECKDKG